MPRPKIRFRNMPEYDFWKFGNFKSYSTDMLFDFEFIYKWQLKRFSEFMLYEFKEEIEENIQSLHKASTGLKLLNENRVYLVTEFDVVRLLLYNLEDCLFNNLQMLRYSNLQEENDSLLAGPEYVVTLFAFKGSELFFACDVSISIAMELLIAFAKENLIYAGAFRNKWYAEPRRKERSEK